MLLNTFLPFYFRSLFSSIGEVESCKLIRDKVTGTGTGCKYNLFKTLIFVVAVVVVIVDVVVLVVDVVIVFVAIVSGKELPRYLRLVGSTIHWHIPTVD
jgi:hypothetical protein